MENRSNIAAPGGITRRSFVKGGAMWRTWKR